MAPAVEELHELGYLSASGEDVGDTFIHTLF